MKPFLARNKIVLPLLFLVFGILSTEWINTSWKALTFLSSILVLLTFYNSKYKYLLFISLGILISSQTPPDPNHIESFKNKKADIEGIMFKSIERREDSSRLYLQVHSVTSNNKKYNVNVKVIVTVNDHLYGIYKGHRIRVLNVKLKEFKNYNNPGKFDVKKFYKRKDIYLKGFIPDTSHIISFGNWSNSYSLLENVERRREKFARFIRKNLTFPSSEIYTALTIGEKKGIPSELRDNFSSLGISHLLAISGLHLGAIALIFYFIFDWLLKRSEWILLTYNVPKITAALTIVPIIFYMFVSGFATPVIRAVIMATIYLISIIIGRSHFKLNTLSAAAFIILLIDPSAIFDLSFRLSFLSVLGILIINHYYPLKIFTFKDKVLTSLKTTLIATIFTLPLIINSFGIVSLLSIPANLIFIPLIEFIVVPLGLTSFMLFNISSSVSLPLVELNNQLINFFLTGVENLSSLSIASVTVPYLSRVSTVLYYLSVFLFFITKSSKRLRFITPVIVVLFMLTTSFGYIKDLTNRNLEIYFLDSGIRNTVFVKMENGKNMLINGGDSRFNQKGFIEKNVITSFLLKSGISRVDYLILTENNEDILEGTSYLLSKFRVKYLWTNGSKLNGRVWEEINKRNIKWTDIQTGYEPLHFGKTKIDMLLSPLYDHNFIKQNRVSIRINHENINLLISSDISQYIKSSVTNNNVLNKHTNKIIFSPYIKNNDSLNKLLLTLGPSVLITKKINYDYIRPKNLEIYEISKQGMIKIVSKNNSFEILTNNRYIE